MRIDITEGSDYRELIIEDSTVEEAINLLTKGNIIYRPSETKVKELEETISNLHNEMNDIGEELKACQEEIEELNDECDDWKAKYEAECQQTDILKKTCDELSKDLKKSLDDHFEWKKDYDILLKDRNRLIERLHELSAKFEKGEQE